MKSKKKNKKNTVQSDSEAIDFSKNKLLNSRYTPYLIPLLYFIIFGFIIMTNRPIGNYGVESDFYRSYVPQAKGFLNGNLIIDPNRGPVYQIVLAFTALIFNNDFYSAGKFINILFAGITLIFVFKIIASLINNKAAYLTVLLVAVNFQFMKYSYEAGTDMIFFALYTASIYFILKDMHLNAKNFLIAGILSGLAYLTRYTAISLIFSAMIILAISYYKYKKNSEPASGKSFLKITLSYFLPVLSAVVIWGIICLQKTGMFFYNYNFYNTATTAYKPDTMINDEWTLKYEPTFHSMYDVVTRDFGTFFYKIFIVNFSTYFINDLKIVLPVYISILTVSGLILFLVKFKSDSLRQKYFFLISFVFYLQIIFAFYSERFSLPLIPFYYFLAVNIFYYGILQRFNFNFGKVKLFTLIILSLIAINLTTSFNAASRQLNNVPLGILETANWMKNNYKENPEGKTIMGRAPHIAYYLDMNFEVIPFATTYEDFIKGVKEKNADYIYINQWEVQTLDKNLYNSLLNYKLPHDGLEVVYTSVNPAAVIYKVQK